MNRERIKNVIRALRETPHKDRFGMESWTHPCGTPACAIGNYAARTDLQDAFCLQRGEYGGTNMLSVDGRLAYLEDQVAAHFGLTEQEAELLFGSNGCGGATTTEQAIAFLEWYLQKPERTDALGRLRTPPQGNPPDRTSAPCRCRSCRRIASLD